MNKEVVKKVDEDAIARITGKIFRDLYDKDKKRVDKSVLDHFKDLFSFVDKEDLKNILGETFYQARFLERTQSVLNLETVEKMMVKNQIILYASIYEALIDYFLEKKTVPERFKNNFKKIDYTRVGGANGSGFASGVVVTYDQSPVFLCHKKETDKKLKYVQFNHRLEAARVIGIIPTKPMSDHISTCYKIRNTVHLLNEENYSKINDNSIPLNAYATMNRFIAHLKTWVDNGSKEPSGESFDELVSDSP